MVKIEIKYTSMWWGKQKLHFTQLVFPECPYASERKTPESSDCKCKHPKAPGIYCGTMNITKKGYTDCPFDIHEELRNNGNG